FVIRSLRIVIVLGVAVGISAILYIFKPKADRRETIDAGRPVKVLIVQSKRTRMDVEGYGTVRPRDTLKLIAEVKGQIVSIHPSFQEGGFIPKGAFLVKIDPRTYHLEAERRKVQIEQVIAEQRRLEQEILNLNESMQIAESDLSFSRKDLDRLRALGGRGVIAEATLDKSEQRHLLALERLQNIKNQLAVTGPLKEQLQAQMEIARTSHRQAILDLERTELKMPFSGWIVEKRIEPGEYVGSGQYLGKIYKELAYEIEIRIPSGDLKWIEPLLEKTPRPKAQVILENEQTPVVIPGTVSRIQAQFDEKTRALPIIVEINDPGAVSGKRHITPGMFVTVTIFGMELESVFTLPRHLVHMGDRVHVLDGDRLKIKPVNVVRRFKESTYIDQGISEGD
ncbi:MAG: HlyD family efflux transporter periplasmic adaptor subunit, partial [Thermodesulfobacteriota bacterium]